MAVSTGRSRVGNLPAETGHFIGRRHELAEVKRLLSRSRLVTLTGVGGVGKTRLALHVATSLQRAFPDGVFFVDVGESATPCSVAETVAEAVLGPGPSRPDPFAAIVDFLADRHALLILDNCEHVLAEAADLVDALLKATPHVRVLATSRQRLNLAAEQTMTVPPLSLPAPDETPTPETIQQYDAVTLFVERAQAARHDFTLTPENTPAVVEISRRLEGVPLAIELAAVWVRTLEPQQLLERLDNQLTLLSGGPRNVPPRHRSLRAMVEWSYEHCTPRERLLWARASVFAGSFDVEAAEAVCGGDDLPTEEVVVVLADLIDKSIILREEQDGRARYRMLETLRQYGRHQLVETGEEATIRRRHRQHYQRLAELAAREAFGPHQLAWIRRLKLDRANLRAALEHCLTEPGDDQNAGLRLAADLLYLWLTDAAMDEGRRWLDRVLAEATEPSVERLRALWARSWLAVLDSDVATAQATLEQARAFASDDDPTSRSHLALLSAHAAIVRDDPDAALASLEEALAAQRDVGDRHGVALTLLWMVLVHSLRGDSQAATRRAQECLEVCDAAGDVWHKAYALVMLGIEAWRSGNTPRATSAVRESLRLHHSLDNRFGVVLALEVSAWIAATDGRYDRAARLLGALGARRKSLRASMPSYGYLARYHNECVERTRQALGEEAYEEALRHGAELSLEQAVAYGLKQRSTRVAAKRAGEPVLTRREREVAELIAQGRSNKEIANQLVISQRTAESHVENILVKLGFTSRAQIAAWSAQQEQQLAERD
ncbi:ATP-binding protein [Thermasporomyces composti]|uniref:Non-specific serine/threonine protein kinase n=1 Tax=Thermasporomyces composti TaxID=696763 RepID=A0A3D9V7Y0_THECX|nr:LuxR C-terminal-related transcriptional regulator [Thermasporomyces composti]REF36260.1 non-specific serine/threonine protein kinase [Thermasporomyces composti]